ncbi:MAG: 50S ribosomal protein L23 [Candidatus Aenigmatarchaeota archaeon]
MEAKAKAKTETKTEKKSEKTESKIKLPSILKKKEPKEKVTAKIVTEKSDEKSVVDAFDVLKFVLMTEKAIQTIEKQNKLIFIVNRKSCKSEIKVAAEAAFKSPVAGVQTIIDQKGRKKAAIRFKDPGAAGDIAIRLGII